MVEKQAVYLKEEMEGQVAVEFIIIIAYLKEEQDFNLELVVEAQGPMEVYGVEEVVKPDLFGVTVVFYTGHKVLEVVEVEV